MADKLRAARAAVRRATTATRHATDLHDQWAQSGSDVTREQVGAAYVTAAEAARGAEAHLRLIAETPVNEHTLVLDSNSHEVNARYHAGVAAKSFGEIKEHHDRHVGLMNRASSSDDSNPAPAVAELKTAREHVGAMGKDLLSARAARQRAGVSEPEHVEREQRAAIDAANRPRS